MLLCITSTTRRKMIEIQEEDIQGEGYIAIESYVGRPDPLIFIYKQKDND